MLHLRQSVRKTDPEAGFILLMVLFLLAILVIALAVAAPKVAVSIRRDKEQELMHRGLQYKRAIKLYYKKFGAYPTSIDQLLNTNQIRFLRKRYTDPMTGKDDWKLIYYGQAKVPPMGLFGQALAPTQGASVPGLSGGSTPGSTSAGTAGSSVFGSSASSGSDNADSSVFGTDSSTSGTGTTANPTATPGTTGAGTTGGSGFGSSSDSPMGAGPIVGVKIPDTQASLMEYKKQKHYSEWEFVYNPLEDQMQAAANLFGGGNTQNVNGTTSNTGSPGFGPTTNSGTGNSSTGNSGSSSNLDFGGTSSSPTQQQ